jgi:hypothetical protein
MKGSLAERFIVDQTPTEPPLVIRSPLISSPLNQSHRSPTQVAFSMNYRRNLQ